MQMVTFYVDGIYHSMDVDDIVDRTRMFDGEEERDIQLRYITQNGDIILNATVMQTSNPDSPRMVVIHLDGGFDLVLTYSASVTVSRTLAGQVQFHAE